MKTKLLFPSQFKRIGWFLFVPSSIIGILMLLLNAEFKLPNSKVFVIYSGGPFEQEMIFGFIKGNYTNTIVGILILIGALFIALSREKYEDEFIAKTRLESLVWATYVNYAILIFCFLFFFDFNFLWIMIFNMYTILVFFIIRFNYMLYKSKKSLNYEK